MWPAMLDIGHHIRTNPAKASTIHKLVRLREHVLDVMGPDASHEVPTNWSIVAHAKGAKWYPNQIART